jgi:AAA domain
MMDEIIELTYSCNQLLVDNEGEVRLQGEGRRAVIFISRSNHKIGSFTLENDKKIDVEERWWPSLHILHAVKKGGCIKIHGSTGGEMTPLIWHLHTVCPQFLEKADNNTIERFLHRILDKDKGFLDTMFSRFTWTHDRVEHIIPIKSAVVMRFCRIFGITVEAEEQQALTLVDRYEGETQRNEHYYKGDTALPPSFFQGRKKGMDYLLKKGFFVAQTQLDGLTWYKTPDVVKAETMIIRALKTLCIRARRHGTVKISDDELDGLDELQREAVHMILDHAVSVFTGGPGCGKSHTLAQLLKWLRAAVFTPSHVSKKVQRRFVQDCGARAGVEVIQFCPYMFSFDYQACKFRASRRGRTFLHGIDVQCDENGFFGKDALRGRMTTLVLDEAGMMDLNSVAAVLTWGVEHFPDFHRVVFCGDPHQFQSVMRGCILQDMIDADLPHVQLKLSHRANGALVHNFEPMIDGDASRIKQDRSFTVHDCTQYLTQYTTTSMEFEKKHMIPMKALYALYDKDVKAHQEPHIMTYDKKGARHINTYFEKEILGSRPKGCGPRKNLKMQVLSNDYEKQGLSKRDLVVLQEEVDYDVEPEQDEKTGQAIKRCCLTLRRWLGPETADEDEFFKVVLRVRALKKDFDVAYATTGHCVQGGQMPYTICDAVDNVVYNTRQSIYTCSSRSQIRSRIVTARTNRVHKSKLDLHTILERPAPVRVSDLSRLIKEADVTDCEELDLKTKHET